MSENDSNAKQTSLLIPSENLDQSAPFSQKISSTAKELIALAIPNTLTFVLQNLADFATLYFIGLIGDSRYTGVVGLGLTWYNISAYSIVLGFCSTIDTFVPQYFGNNQFEDCGVCYYRAIIIVLITSFPFSILLSLGGPLLQLLGIDSITAGLAGKYAINLVPNLFIHAQYELLRKFLNAQRIANPTTAVTIITTLLHPLWCYLFIFQFTSGSYLGAAYAKTMTNFLSIMLLFAYVKYTNCCKDTFVPVNYQKVLSDWKPFIKLAIPSALMICLDWWAYEIMNVMAGILGADELSANVALVQINMMFYMIPVGIGTSACTFVGNSIGAGNTSSGKFYIMVGAGLNFCIILTADILLLILRYSVAHYFFSSGPVTELFGSVVFILAVSEIFDTAQGLLGRILVGMRMQQAATAAVIIAYYFIMIPSGFLFLFVFHKGLHGLWYANCLAATSLACIYIFIILRADWQSLVQEAKKDAQAEAEAKNNEKN